MTETETKWSERVKEWKASGQTAKAFAHGRDFKPSTLTYWAYRLRRVTLPSDASAMKAEPTTRSTRTPQVRMVRVRPTGLCRASPTRETAMRASTSSAVMEIMIGAARIEVRSGFDRVLLSQLVEALGGAR